MAPGPTDVVQVVGARTVEVVERLRQLTEAELGAPSLLPGWSRLTITSHLRFGAVAFRRLTEGGIAGTATAYYPRGRTAERPLTLLPRPDEKPSDVIDSLESESTALQDLWNRITHDEWDTVVQEPEDNPDLGPLPVSTIPLLRPPRSRSTAPTLMLARRAGATSSSTGSCRSGSTG